MKKFIWQINTLLDEKTLGDIDTVQENKAIRLFDGLYIYEVENEDGKKYKVIVTIVKGGNYARMLHGMANTFEIKNFILPIKNIINIIIL